MQPEAAGMSTDTRHTARKASEPSRRIWTWKNGFHELQVSTTRPPDHIVSVEYIRSDLALGHMRELLTDDLETQR
jgi:hypothetical protein